MKLIKKLNLLTAACAFALSSAPALAQEVTIKAVSAWAAPAPGRHRHRSASPEDFKFLGLRSGESVRPGDLPSSISGSLAYQIRRAIEDGKTDNRNWSTKPNWLGVASVVIPLVVLVATHI